MVSKESPVLPILFVEDDEADFLTLKSQCNQLRNLRPQIFRVLKSADVASVIESTGAALCFYAIDSEDSEADSQEVKDLIQKLWQRDVMIPVITLGKWRGSDGGVGSLQAGATDFLIKSAIRPSILERSVRFALEREKQKKKARRLKKEISLSRTPTVPVTGQADTLGFNRLKHLIQNLSDHLHDSLSRDNPKQMLLRDLQFAARMTQNALNCIHEIEEPDEAKVDHFTTFNLQQIALETTELLGRMLRNNIALSCTPCRGSDIFIYGDPSEIQEMLIHLALNSQEAMPEGGTINISFSIPDQENPSQVDVLFRDSGYGIPEEHLTKVFDPDYTTRQTSLGFGLGLTVVSATMERHQGNVSISSQKGRGTTVTMTFPLHSPSESIARGTELIEDQEAPGSTAVRNNGFTPSILLYSCYSEEQHLICMYARAAGLETIIASDQEQLQSIIDAEQSGILAYVIDSDSLDPAICNLIETHIADGSRSLFLVGDTPGHLSNEMIQLEQASFFQRPAEYVFLAASLAELAGT